MRACVLPGMLVLLAALSGCATKKAASPTTETALDVSPGAASPAPISTYSPASVNASPVMAAPDSAYTQTPLPAAAPAGAGNYTVKKGDTLYKIARDHYGDGKQWQRIASANPGVTPQSLRVGQTLVLP